MKVSCSNGFAPWAVVRWRQRSAPVIFLVIGKNGSQAFLLSLTPLMRPYIVKMTWSHPKMPFPQRVQLLLGSLSPSKFGDEISSFADPGCLSQIPNRGSRFFPSQIPDSGSKFFPSWIPDPGSKFFPSRILDPGSSSKNLSILTKKNDF